MIFSADETDLIGIVKDFTALVVTSEIDEKAMTFLMHIIKFVHEVDFEEELQEEIVFINTDDCVKFCLPFATRRFAKQIMIYGFFFSPMYLLVWFIVLHAS